ncbi:MAG: MFS transporter [Hadesarchaea archaeon]|nr:MFS transporter [Hadesarchaea archaeon]
MLIGTFVIALSMGMAGLALPLYAKDLGATYTEIGMLGVAYVVFDALFSIPVGRAGDRWGRKPFLVLGFFATASLLAFYSLANAVVWLIALRFVQGATEAPIWVNAQGAVADLSATTRRGRAIGAYGTSWGLGFGVGPIIGGVLYVGVGAGQTFLLSAIVAFLATAIISTVPLPRPKLPGGKPNLSRIWPACFAGLIYVGVVSILFTLLPVYATRGLGMSEVQAGFLITLFAGVRAVLFTPLGGLSDRVGRRPVILAGVIGSSFLSAAIAMVSGFPALAAIILLLAVAEGAVYPAVVSTVSRAGEGRNMGYVLGIFNAIAMVGWGLFPGVGGALADAYGPTSPFLMCAVVGLAAAALLWKLLPRK